MTTTTVPTGNKKYKIIDADTHLTEPPTLWVDRAPPGLRSRMPQIGEYNGVRLVDHRRRQVDRSGHLSLQCDPQGQIEDQRHRGLRKDDLRHGA